MYRMLSKCTVCCMPEELKILILTLQEMKTSRVSLGEDRQASLRMWYRVRTVLERPFCLLI